MKIAVLVTVFNRKYTTVSFLNDLFNQEDIARHSIDIYIVDGGSSDGTVESVKSKFPFVNIVAENGLYWAGGMRKAWSIAIEQEKDYDLYWLANDDTHLFCHALKEGVEAHEYSLKTFNKGGVYIESTISPTKNTFSYGGRKLYKQNKSKCHIVFPNNTYQKVELGNANSMFVSKDVFNSIGGFCDYCTHGIADYDYSMRTVRAGFPCFITPTYCGECEDDHGNNWKSGNVNLKERIKYLYSPKGLAYKEYLHYIKLFFPQEYFSAALKLWLKTLFPFIWDYFKHR